MQVVAVKPAEVAPLLDAIGTPGVYLHVDGIADAAALRELESEVRHRHPR